jgi:hypothetical protein
VSVQSTQFSPTVQAGSHGTRWTNLRGCLFARVHCAPLGPPAASPFGSAGTEDCRCRSVVARSHPGLGCERERFGRHVISVCSIIYLFVCVSFCIFPRVLMVMFVTPPCHLEKTKEESQAVVDEQNLVPESWTRWFFLWCSRTVPVRTKFRPSSSVPTCMMDPLHHLSTGRFWRTIGP